MHADDTNASIASIKRVEPGLGSRLVAAPPLEKMTVRIRDVCLSRAEPDRLDIESEL
jgi:hypothetical protein